MDNEHNKKVAAHVDSVLTDIKYNINKMISQLIAIEDYTFDENKLSVIHTLMDKLKQARDMTPGDLGLTSKDGKYVVDESFNNHQYYGYDVREKRYNRLDKTQQKRQSQNMYFLVARLQKKKGNIMKKQLRVTDKLINQNLYEFQRNNEAFLNKIQKEINKLKKNRYSGVALSEYKVSIAQKRAEAIGRMPKASALATDIRKAYISIRTNDLKNKAGKIQTDLNKRLATSISEKIKDKMRNAAKKIGNVFNRVKYAIPNAYEDSHSR